VTNNVFLVALDVPCYRATPDSARLAIDDVICRCPRQSWCPGRADRFSLLRGDHL